MKMFLVLISLTVGILLGVELFYIHLPGWLSVITGILFAVMVIMTIIFTSTTTTTDSKNQGRLNIHTYQRHGIDWSRMGFPPTEKEEIED